ncbi:MAG: hypothetical protein AAGD35_13715 [Actinomycetota bacterium]
MTIREALEDLMAGRGVDPAAVLDGYGFGDLPTDSLATALGHFADTAPIEVADALAPIVTRLSEVPFAEGDLPFSAEVDGLLGDGSGLLDALADLELPGLAEGSVDPSDFDVDGLTDVTDAADAVGLDADGGSLMGGLAQDIGARFGLGDESPVEEAEQAFDELTDADLDDVREQAEPYIDQVAEAAPEVGGLLDDLVEQLDLPDEVDPGDLDFD